MVLLGVILILGILLWRVVSGLEWSIPLKCQSLIEAWRERLSSKTHSLNYVWDSYPGEGELEKHFWRLQKELPQLRKRVNVPLWIEVYVFQGRDTRQNQKYLSCLKRRFPEIEITMGPLYGEGRDTWGDT